VEQEGWAMKLDNRTILIIAFTVALWLDFALSITGLPYATKVLLGVAINVIAGVALQIALDK
jgi:hypothetical protein